MTEIISTADDAVLKNSIDNLKAFDTHIGRPPRYEDSETGLEQFKQDTVKYFESVRAVNNMLDADSKPLIITVEGWLTSMQLTRQSLSRYRARGGAWAEYIDYTREIILTNKLQRYMTGAVPPVSAVFDLVNNHQYHNTNDAGHYTDVIIESPQKIEYPKLIDIAESKGENA